MSLNEAQKKFLRGRAHALNPVVWIGNAGITDAIARETQLALEAHELIKIKYRGADRAARDAGLAALAERTDAQFVQRIGNIAVFYRKHPKLPKIVIPD